MTSKKTIHFEEILNTYSHAFGVLLFLIGAIILFQKDISTIPYLSLGLGVYCFSLILLFSASTIYHAIEKQKLKRKFRILDHISIYYLIAGTYTPVCLTLLKDSKGILLLYLVWGIAIFGTFLKLFFTGKFEAFSLILYAIMGWLVVLDLNFLIEEISSKGLFFIALGGAFYTIGIVFYAIKRIPYNHFIWHLFVLGGAISHWFFIYTELL